MSLITNDATYTYKPTNNSISLRGTNISELGDIFADALLLIPKFTSFGVVSLGGYIQAKTIYNEIKDKINTTMPLYITGHSLGGGVAQILALMVVGGMSHDTICITCQGSIKVLGLRARRLLKENTNIVYNVRYRDIVPTLGWWLEPIHTTKRTGNKKSWLLDYSLAEHMAYWD